MIEVENNEATPLANVRVEGLMTMGPLDDDAERVRPYFQQTRRLFDEIEEARSEAEARRTRVQLEGMDPDARVWIDREAGARSEPDLVGMQSRWIEAARNGKQVTAVVELKARFDEAANIRWANRLSAYGIHVTYGVVGLKTHCKAVLVVRQDYDGLRRYAHVGTGNYHAGTARLYSDLGILTNDEDLGRDAGELFSYLTTGYTPERYYRKLMPAPMVLKSALLTRIER